MVGVRSHVALLRGVNVGPRNQLDMGLLRELATELGLRDVVTYLRSGNLLFAGGRPDSAGALEAAIEARTGLRTAVVVLTAAQLAGIVRRNPFPGAPDPKRMHVVFRAGSRSTAETAAIDAAAQRQAAAGSGDRVRIVSGTVYLHTPDGFGRSRLAGYLARDPAATIRNWNTVTKLNELVASTAI